MSNDCCEIFGCVNGRITVQTFPLYASGKRVERSVRCQCECHGPAVPDSEGSLSIR